MYCRVQYSAGEAMEAEKTVGLTFRVTQRMKRMLEAAAGYERRSMTNMFEVLVEDYCQRRGLAEDDKPKQIAAKPGKTTT